MTKTLAKHELDHFTGSETWHRHALVRTVLFTDGVKYVADAGEAYWLIDEIAFAQKGNPSVRAEPFQSWTLKVAPDHTATLTCEDGNGRIVVSKAIEYTDFPLPEITLWCTDNVILLPSEY
jgi:hypothetical protein